MSGAWRRPGALAGSALALSAVVGVGARAMPDRARTPATHSVTIDASSYRPARLAVHVGDTVVWVNKDLIPHTVSAGDGTFDSQTLAAGASWRFTVGAKGTTGYACRFHPTMTGRIEAAP